MLLQISTRGDRATNKRILRIIGVLFLLLVSIFFNCHAEANSKLPVMFIGGQTTGNNLQIAKKAFNLFLQECPSLINYADKILQIHVSFNENEKDCTEYRCEKYGWTKEVAIKIKVKSDLPPRAQTFVAPPTPKYTLFYYLGGGKFPGILANKKQEKCFCGIQKNGVVNTQTFRVLGDTFSFTPDSYTFKKVDAFAFIDQNTQTISPVK